MPETGEKDRSDDTDLTRKLEAPFLSAPTPPVSPHLAGRILSALPPQDPLQHALGWLLQSWWRPLSAAVLPLMLGGVIGLSAPPTGSDEAYVDLASGLSLTDAYIYLPEDLDDY